ncbi:hypothetical protein Q8814_24515, partial [Rhodococcus sp. CC-R104]|nr:hypothetical protein [Rhodococcus sp. CC-R104]
SNADADCTTSAPASRYLMMSVASSTPPLAASAPSIRRRSREILPLLLEQGFSPSVAALTLGLGGAGQVLGRLGYLTLVARTSVRGRIVGILAGTAATTALLGAVTTAAALISAAIGAGLVRGLFTLIQATAITDRWGSTHYGRLSGLMSAPVVVVMALAPWAGTALAAATGSYADAYLVLAGVAAIAAVVAVASVTPDRGFTARRRRGCWRREVR